MPAGLQSFFNPLLDVPYYKLAHDWLPGCPRLVAGLAGLPYGMLVFLTWRIARRVLGHGWPAALACAIGASGTTVVAEIGTSFGDIPTADLLLGAFWCGLAALERADAGRTACGSGRPAWDTARPAWVAAWLGAGALAGAAVGLKPTNAALAPALLLALAAPLRHRPRRLVSAVALFGAGGLAAVALSWGWWGLELARAFGNPVAPYFNQIFRSPWFAAVPNRDLGFMPHGVLQALFYPFFWLQGRAFVVSETSFRDARFAAGYLAVAGLAVAAWRRRVALPAPATALLIFFAAGFALWEAAFSIIRYAVALEALSGCVVLLALRSLLPGRLRGLVGAGVIVFILGFGNYAGWGRVRGFRATVLDTPAHELPPDSLVVLIGAPRGFMTLFLHGERIAFIGMAGMDGGTRMWAEASRRIAEHAGPVFLLDRAGESPPVPWGLRAAAPCLALPNPYQRDLELCPASRPAPA
jgi:hypothetical protein